MSENKNELSEQQRRAARISSIKKSIGSSETKDTVADSSPANQSESEWESELAERIAKHVKKVQQGKLSAAEELLRELDSDKSKETSPQTVAEETAETADDTETEETEDILAPEQEVYVPQESEFEQKTAEHEPLPEAEITVPEQASVKPEPPVKKKKKKKKKKAVAARLRALLPEKEDSLPERLRKMVFLGSIVAIIVCGYIVSDYYFDLWRASKINDEVMTIYDTYPVTKDEPEEPVEEGDEKIYTLLDGAKKLLDINKDVVGVISIPDTPVNNPVMQADDNEKYLDVKINGTESRSGEIFLDFRNHFDEVVDGKLAFPNSENLIIYGHNMKNDEMFGTLKYYERNYDYYEAHPLIYLNSNYETYTYKIFAYFIVDAEDETETKFDCWNYLNFNSEEEFYDYVNEAKRRTLRLTNVDVKYGDPLLTLSTCNTILGDRGRLIVMARLVRDGEDPLEGTTGSVENNNIKWPSLYYNSKPNAKYDPDAEFVPYGPASETQTAETTETSNTEE